MREASVEVLNLANRYAGFARALAPPFAGALRESRAANVLDLCSGAGGPVTLLLDCLDEIDEPLPSVTLSDLYPNIGTWRRIVEQWPERVDFVDRPVDATHIPADLEGDMVTVVNALHHFPPKVVEELFREVTQRGSSIFIAEAFARSFGRASAYIPALITAAAVNPFVCERRRFGKLLITFAFPVFMLTGGWDWAVSTMRIYQPDELIAIGRRIAPHYRWTEGEEPFWPWGRAVYVFGRPEAVDLP